MRRTVITGISEGRGVVFAGDTLFVATGAGLERVKGESATLVMGFQWGTDLVEASPDGTLVFCNEAKKVHTVEADTGVSTLVWTSTGEGPCCVAPSPDGRTVVVCGGDEGGTVKVHTVGEKRATKTWGSLRYAQVTWIDSARFVSATTPYNKTALKLHSADGATTAELGQRGTRSALATIDGGVFLGTKKGVVRLTLEPSADKALGSEIWTGPPVTGLAARARELFVATEAGVFVIEGDGAARQLDAAHAIAIAAGPDRVAVVEESGSVVVLS